MIFPKNKFVVFQGMEPSSPRLEKLLIFQKRTFQDQKMEKTHSENVFFYFRRWNFLASRLKNFLYFSKSKFLIFQERVSKAQKNKKNIFFFSKIYIFIFINQNNSFFIRIFFIRINGIFFFRSNFFSNIFTCS